MKVCPACGTEYGDDAAFCSRDRTPLPTSGGGLIGQVIGDRYQIERKLGEGGMGEVYLARHVLMDRLCAIKIMSPALSKDPDAIARFNREATNASKISHPNVCAVYDFGFTPDGVLYLAMEYLEGRELSDLMASGPLPLDRAVAVLAQCAAGLEAAHELGIVHRDLKPDNIMVLEQRGREVVKLVDFGIAKAAQGEEGQRVTKTGLVVGTPEYMSPEQLSGDRMDGRSDEYSLALVLYRMLTGALPFTATSAQETMVKRLTERPKRLSEMAGTRRYPAALDDVIDRALARTPDERFATVGAFAEAVTRAATPEPATVALPRTVVAPRARGRRRGLMALGAVALLSLAFVVWRAGGGAAASPAATPVGPLAATTDSIPTTVPESAIDTTAGRSDTAPSPEPAVVTPPPPPPVAPASSRLADPGAGAALTQALPTLEDFDDPNSQRARDAFNRARLAIRSGRLPRAQAAEMAWLVGVYELSQNRKLAAAEAFRRSCRLDPAPRCRRMLSQLKDVP